MKQPANDVLASLVKIIDPKAYTTWETGNLDHGSKSDEAWQAAKHKAEKILNLFDTCLISSADPNATGHRGCPFCGGEPRLYCPTYDGPADCWDTYIQCSQCEARSPGIIREHGDDEECAVHEAWLQWDQRVVDDSRLLTSTSATFIKAIETIVTDLDLATRVWKTVLSVTGTNPVGWTQPREIERLQSGEPDISAQFWTRRNMDCTRSMLRQLDIEVPDDVPLYAAPVSAMLPEVTQSNVIDLQWSVGGEGGAETHYVETIIGKYAAWMKNEEAHVFVPGAIRSQIVGSVIEQALQYAQNHFSAQIRGQLKR
jgi:hypothetical protein